MPWEDRYDASRQIGPDPRDPRMEGPPCSGSHQPAPPGRGSLTGCNGSGSWVTCQRCKLRLSYTPAYGAHAMTRSPGPLPADTSKKVTELGTEAAYHPEMRDKTIAYSAAESSLLDRLDHVRRLKGQAYADQGQQLPVAPKIENPGMVANEQVMSLTGPKKAPKRVEETAEELEERQSQQSWSLPTTPARTP